MGKYKENNTGNPPFKELVLDLSLDMHPKFSYTFLGVKHSFLLNILPIVHWGLGYLHDHVADPCY